MHSNPIFTDYRGEIIRRPRKRSRILRPWEKFLVVLLAFGVASLFVADVDAVTQLDLTTQVKGLLGGANGGLNANASSFTGILREASGTGSASELSGDVTTSGSNATTVVKLNGATITTNSAADQTIISSASGTLVYKTIPDCQNGALAYTQSTHALSCVTVLTGTFADNETPSGTIDGSNAVFTLAHTPSPAASLTCLKNNGGVLAGGTDYTLATATLTFVAGSKPLTGDSLRCSYRY